MRMRMVIRMFVYLSKFSLVAVINLSFSSLKPQNSGIFIREFKDMNEDKYRFVVEWFDETVKVKRQFLLSFYPSDGSVDMYDLLTKKIFLRKIKCANVQLSDLYVGSVINVLSRQLFITDFADKKTSEKFSRDVESTILVINESGFRHFGRIISALEDNGLTLNKGKMMDKEKYGFNSSSFSDNLEAQFIVFEVRGEGAVRTLKKLMISDSDGSVRSNIGDLKKYCLAPSDEMTAKQEVKVFFPGAREIPCNTTRYRNSSICIIKPHAVREKICGKIIQCILDAGFQISALQVITFNSSTASEFLDVYKGVVAEYKDMVSQLMSGPCIALEVSGEPGRKVTLDLRTLVGPADPEIARKLRPGTLRAVFGHDKVKNAVHCTDLPDDALLELDYVFKILPA